jgi:hypothetical protein
MATVKYAAVWAGWRGGRRWALEADRGLEPEAYGTESLLNH